MCTVFFAYFYTYMCVPGTKRIQKRALNFLELELRMFVSHYVDAGKNK